MHDPRRSSAQIDRTKGTFTGYFSQLERLQRKYNGRIRWMPTFCGTSVTKLHVDATGAIYRESPDTPGKYSVYVGQCELLPE